MESRLHSSGPIVFLDIDGVLNRTVAATHIRLDEDLVARLKVLTDRTSASVVLTTFWREYTTYIAYVLSRFHVRARVLGRTPGLASSPLARGERRYASRSDEICAWLEQHAEQGFGWFVVLDDRADAGLGALAEHFVRTDPERGLTDADVERALAILERKGPIAAARGRDVGRSQCGSTANYASRDDGLVSHALQCLSDSVTQTTSAIQ